jgi:hypothetical protein
MPVSIVAELEDKCVDCGIALKLIEVAGEIQGSFADYLKHEMGSVRMTFCSGCWERITETMMKDQGDAILKRKELERGY